MSEKTVSLAKPEAPNSNAMAHGHARKKRTKTYCVWEAMKDRCRNPNNKYFHRYGGRGIKVSERWMSFANFLEDMGEKPDGMTLERTNNNGWYESSNCVWALPIDNYNNTSKCVFLTYLGRTMTLSQWEREVGAKQGRISWRIRHGWSIERAISLKARVKACPHRPLTPGSPQ